MPDIDGAHGSLTTLLPLNVAPCRRLDGTVTSPAHALRELLARVPTARHSPVCAASNAQSPFARSAVTHFARFAVIDAPAFNGRTRDNAIRVALPGGVDPLTEPPVDRFPRPYLLFCADFDIGPEAASNPERAIRTYLESLWHESPELWSGILDHCDAATDVASADRFAAYVQSCSVQTTMPFNDYGVTAAQRPIAHPIAAPLVWGVVAGLITFELVRVLVRHTGQAGGLLAILLGVVVLASVASVLIVRAGRQSTPWAEGTNLTAILKALYLQAVFARFAIAHQNVAPDVLLSDFKVFVATVLPSDLADPTQAPGMVPS